MFKKITVSLLFLMLSFYGFSQKDSIKLASNQILIGEVKSMDQSVLVFKTPYSDSDFKIKWWKVKEIYSKREFIMTLTDGRRFNTSIHSDSINTKDVILVHQGKTIKTSLNKITSLDPFTSGSFLKRIELAFDTGFSLTKANNFKQLTMNAKINYKASKWNFLNSFHLVYSRQDNTDDISRYEANINVQRFLLKDWYLSGAIDLLSNSDQQLKLRTTGSLGAGYFVTKTNNLYFGTGAGLAFNNESYTSSSDSKSSLESYFSAELNKYDIGDFSILTSATLSPSLTEKGRVRFDYKFNLKYDITSSIYIKSGLTYNFDNQPVTGATKGDYTFQTTLGWDYN
ncbi:Protein of unknown function, DUF481 [Lutibacter agarilyticus]|uniref:Salt-induced outer membrane protein YdiY n=1 Tax=Lutibacter agarilyticus TaxID=1109740 RepID=A0A238W3L8_9FLAO|nr:DUF481 domain-containing protein [Lutibacter agarilyticus]SNR41106.1 Protein of unknown function, DUF481 [Lutibacter agarilyticus]